MNEPNQMTANSAGWRIQFRFAGSLFWSGMREFNRSACIPDAAMDPEEIGRRTTAAMLLLPARPCTPWAFWAMAAKTR
jgi:hypothetical protein